MKGKEINREREGERERANRVTTGGLLLVRPQPKKRLKVLLIVPSFLSSLPGVNFINILLEAFTCPDPKRSKKQSSRQSFYAFGI